MSERKVLLRVTGDGSDGKRTLREIGAELVKLAAQKAVAEVQVNTTQAKAQLQAFKGDLSTLSTTARIDLQMAGAEAKLEDLRARLARLGTLDASPKVDVRIGQTLAQIERVEAGLSKLAARRAEPEVDVTATEALAKIAEVEAALKVFASRDITAHVRVKVDRGLADLARLRKEAEHSIAGGIGARAITSVLTDVSRVGASFAKLGTEATTLGARIAAGFVTAGTEAASFAGKMGGSLLSSIASGFITIGAAIAVLTVLLALIGPLIVSLVGALFALVAVATSAVAGVGALGVALLAAFGPVAAVVAFVAFQINKVLEAQKKQEAASAAAKNAMLSHQQAEANLASARANQSDQRLAAIQAERDAINALAQTKIALDNAELGVEGAGLNLERARANLKAFKDEQGSGKNSLVTKFKDVETDRLPGALDGAIKKGGPEATAALDYKEKLFAVKTALQGVENSEQAVTAAQVARGKAQAQVAEFQEKGLRAFDGYDQALRQTETATTALAKATTTLVESERNRDEVLGALSPTQTKFAEALTDIKDVLSEALGPAADEVFAGLTDGLGGLEDLLGDSEVQSSLKAIGRALGDVIRVFGRGISTKGFKSAFADLAEGGAELTKVFGGQILPDLFRLLLAIAQEALPSLKKGARGLAASFHGFVEAETTGGKLARQMRFIMSALRSVGRLGGAALGVLIAMFPQASSAGQTLLGWITRNLNRFRAFLKTAEGKESLRKFFTDSIDTVRDLYHLMQDVVKVLRAMSDIAGKIKKATEFSLLDKVKDATGLDIKKQGGKITGFSLLKELGIKLGAEGGIATSPVVAGEAGNEALIPLRPDVLSRLGQAIVGHMSFPSIGLPSIATPKAAGRAGSGSVTNNEFHISAPGGGFPDLSHAMAAVQQRLNAIGA